jgi:hypothetical protein
MAQDGLILELEFTGIDDGDGLEPHTDANAEAAGEGEPSDVAGSEGAEGEGELAPPSATLRTPGREPLPRELRLLEPLAQAALSGATIYTNMGRERRRMERLLVDIAELEARVDTTFVDLGDRERVRAKLREAKELLPQLATQAREVSGAADTLISLLDEAANTAPVAPQRRRGPPAKEGPPRPPPGGVSNNTSNTHPFGATRPAVPRSPAPAASPPASAPPPASPAPAPAPPVSSSAP